MPMRPSHSVNPFVPAQEPVNLSNSDLILRSPSEARASRRMAANPNLLPWFETARIAAKCTQAAPAMARLLTMRPSALELVPKLKDLQPLSCATSRSARLHPGLADDRRRFRCGEELQECTGGVGRPGRLMHGGGELRHLLDVGRQRSEIIDPFHRQQLAYLLEPDLGVAARNHLADRHVRDRRDDLGLELIGQAPLRDQALNMAAAWPRRIRNRACGGAALG